MQQEMEQGLICNRVNGYKAIYLVYIKKNLVFLSFLNLFIIESETTMAWIFQLDDDWEYEEISLDRVSTVTWHIRIFYKDLNAYIL